MSSLSVFLRQWIHKAERDLDQIAHESLASGLEYEQYLIAVGKYRKLRSIVQGLHDRLKKQGAPPDLPDPDADLDELEDDEPQQVEEPVVRRRTKHRPRTWGG